MFYQELMRVKVPKGELRLLIPEKNIKIVSASPGIPLAHFFSLPTSAHFGDYGGCPTCHCSGVAQCGRDRFGLSVVLDSLRRRDWTGVFFECL